MRMEKLKVGFERRRGLIMTIGSMNGITRDSVNWTQLRMLRHCEVPGLLPVESEELDGVVTFRYDLNGCRMLGEALRIVKWTMSDFMNALCRLAEALEDCRLYLLDANRILLSDEFIFMAGDGQEIRFTYLPVTFEPVGEDRLERLVVRWMTRVEELDGQAVQQVLRIVGAPDFAPRTLRGFIRDYLAGSSRAGPSETPHSPSISMMPAESYEEIRSETEKPERTVPESDKRNRLPWRLLQPPSGDPHALSELLGGDWLAGEANRPVKPVMDPHRRRTLTGVSAVAAVAAAWRFGYMDHPGQSGLLLALGVTVIALASVLLLWNGAPKRDEQPIAPKATPGREGDQPPDREEEESPDSGAPRFQIHVAEQGRPASGRPAAAPLKHEQPAETTWLPASLGDRTELLVSERREQQAACYLLWETKGDGSRVPLAEHSVVIGRSAEAARHVDETDGVSRAHAEVLRDADQWKVKDLGSRNGSKLNDVPMTPYELYPLQPGDRLVLANSHYRFIQEHAN
ncbi:MAG: FHA domain-containing protein [Cohnella sp.]|nr:FHA domain-containing protein [Cohnella sp.]